MSENKDPKLAKEEEDKKKKAATWLPGASTVNRSKFGTMLSRGGPLGKILASKAGVLGLALGVTALASLAGVMIAKQDPADMANRTAPKVASRAAKYYTPSGARSSNRSSLSLIAGNQDYGQEVAKASAEPEEAVEEALPETPAMPELPAAAKGRKFSSSGLGGSTGGGGGSSAVMGNKSSGKTSQNTPAASSVLSDAFNSAKLGSGVRSTGMSRTPERAASGKTGSRQAVSTQQMQAAATPAGAELAGALEKKKAKSGEVFGEGVSPASGSTKAASGSGLSDSYSADMPESDDDSSTDSSSSGGGGGGGSGTADESASAACDEAESQMERALGILQTSIGNLADMTAKSDDASLDKLCNYDKSGTTDQNIDNVNGALNDMNAANEQLTAESCQDAFDNNGWSCGVIDYTQTKAAAFLTQVNGMCSNYFVSRSLEEKEGKTNFWTGSAGYMNYSDQHLKAEQAYKQQLESDDYKKAIEDMTNLDQKMNGSDSDGTGTGSNDGVSQMKSNYYANDCTYEEQGIGEFTADQTEVVGGDSQWKKMYDAVTGALSDAWNGVSTWVTNAWNDASAWVTQAFNDAVAWTEQAVDDVGEWIGNAYEDASEWVNNAVNDAVDWTVQAANDAGVWITNAANDVGDAVSGFVSDVGDTLGDAWNSVTNWLGF